MTYGDELIEKGRQETRGKAVLDGRVATVKRLLRAGLEWSIIEQATGIDQEALDALANSVPPAPYPSVSLFPYSHTRADEIIRRAEEELRREGRQEGRKEGRREGQVGIVEDLLRAGVSWSFIESVIDIDEIGLRALVRRLTAEMVSVDSPTRPSRGKSGGGSRG